jgi:primosomal protein N' (replication factor Y) (superfamily II helicase)
MLRVLNLVSPVRFFDASMLELARWVSERYVAPLATVLGRMSPPRVASEEEFGGVTAGDPRGGASLLPSVRPETLLSYSRGSDLVSAIGSRAPSTFLLRPAPEDEQLICVDVVSACLAAGRRAIVLVPEASPVPATAAALREAFGDRVCLFIGGDKRARYRAWLSVRAGVFDVVVGTRPGVFAPVRDVGVIYVSRESHPAHREDRAPYYHVRDVALARAGIEEAVTVLEALCPSSEAAAIGMPKVAPRERRWPKVEVVRPGPEGRAPRLVQALKRVRRGFIYAPLPGYGVAAVCKACGSPASCAACGGTLRLEEGVVRCVVCGATGRCAVCGAGDFGIRRGGVERVEEWAARVAAVPVARPNRPRLPKATGEILVGGPDQIRDLGLADLDLVAVLDADLAARRPGIAARERALSVWMETVGWARPNGGAIVQASHPSDPGVQALVRGSPERFLERERERRTAAGFPVGAPVFRVVGTAALEQELDAFEPITSLVSSLGGRTVCLLALEPGRVAPFGVAMRELAVRGVVERVEAEPHL